MSIFSRAAVAANLLLGTSFRALKHSAPSQRILPSVNKLLKLDNFEKRRQVAQEKVKLEKPELLMNIANTLERGNPVDSGYIKEFLFLADSEDLELVIAALKMLESPSQTAKVRLSAFNTDATLMRLCYYLNAAELAYNTFLDPGFKHTYVGYTSVLILLQLLYNNAMYTQIIDCVEHLEEKQCMNIWSSSQVAIFFLISCLRISTPDSFKKAVQYVNKYSNYKHPTEGCALIAAYCAITADPSKVNYCINFVKQYRNTEVMRSNVLMQFLVKENNLVMAVDLLGGDSCTLTQDTADMILSAVGEQGAAHLKTFFTDHVKVLPENLSELIIEHSFNYKYDEKEAEKNSQLEERPTAVPLN